MVPDLPTTTKVLLSYATALSFSVVPEVLLYHEIPSDEVTIVPVSPTATNNGLEVVVVVVVAVESVDSSLFPTGDDSETKNGYENYGYEIFHNVFFQ